MSQHTTILAFDSSVQGGSVCLWHDEVLYSAHLEQAESQASQLVSLIEAQLNAAGIWYDDVTDLAVTVGPGSFTGIRIALSVARTLQFSYPRLRWHAFTTLECLAAARDETEKPLHVSLRAGKGELYFQTFQGMRALGDIALIQPEALPVADEHSLLVEGELPQAEAMVGALQRGFVAAQADLKPLYIRPPDAVLPSKAQI